MSAYFATLSEALKEAGIFQPCLLLDLPCGARPSASVNWCSRRGVHSSSRSN